MFRGNVLLPSSVRRMDVQQAIVYHIKQCYNPEIKLSLHLRNPQHSATKTSELARIFRVTTVRTSNSSSHPERDNFLSHSYHGRNPTVSDYYSCALESSVETRVQLRYDTCCGFRCEGSRHPPTEWTSMTHWTMTSTTFSAGFFAIIQVRSELPLRNTTTYRTAL